MPTDDERPAGQEAPEAQPAPPPADEKLTAAEKRAAEAEAKAAAAEQARLAAEAKYQRDMGQVAQWYAQQQQAPAQPQQEIDPDAIVDRRTLAAELDARVTQTEINAARQIRATARQFVARDTERFPHFKKYQGEIDGLLDQLDPRVAAQPGAYEEVYKAVIGRHADEVINEEVEKRLAARQRPAQDEDYEDDEPLAARRPDAPVPAADARAARQPVTSVSRRRQPPLDEDEKFVAQRYFGGDAERYRRARDGEDDDDDWLGLNKKQRA